MRPGCPQYGCTVAATLLVAGGGAWVLVDGGGAWVLVDGGGLLLPVVDSTCSIKPEPGWVLVDGGGLLLPVSLVAGEGPLGVVCVVVVSLPVWVTDGGLSWGETAGAGGGGGEPGC